jgi:anthranilate phosphoribosyltransferase
VVDPRDLGLATSTLDDLRGGDRRTNADAVHRLVGGVHGPVRDVVALNAAAGFVVTGVAADLADGLEHARRSIDSGAAAAALDALVRRSASAATTDHR